MKTSGVQHEADAERPAAAGARYHVKLPPFLLENDIGLGDAVKQFTQRLHIAPCDGCRRRAEMLNRAVMFHRSDQ